MRALSGALDRARCRPATAGGAAGRASGAPATAPLAPPRRPPLPGRMLAHARGAQPPAAAAQPHPAPRARRAPGACAAAGPGAQQQQPRPAGGPAGADAAAAAGEAEDEYEDDGEWEEYEEGEDYEDFEEFEEEGEEEGEEGGEKDEEEGEAAGGVALIPQDATSVPYAEVRLRPIPTELPAGGAAAFVRATPGCTGRRAPGGGKGSPSGHAPLLPALTPTPLPASHPPPQKGRLRGGGPHHQGLWHPRRGQGGADDGPAAEALCARQAVSGHLGGAAAAGAAEPGTAAWLQGADTRARPSA
jgi:hypothetical protein